MFVIITTGKLMKCYVFAYGTLLDEKTRESVLGYKTSIYHTQLRGFRKTSLILNNIMYPIIIKDSIKNEIIEGAYFEINEKDLKLLDEYESDRYAKIKVKLENGLEAWTYCSK